MLVEKEGNMKMIPWKKASSAILVLLLTLFAAPALAHFGMVIPSDTMVMQDDKRTVTVTLSFSHPMEMVGMILERPKVFSVFHGGKSVSLVDQLKQAEVMGQKGWTLAYRIRRPGVYVLYMEPQPYWEPAEDCYIIHMTKTVLTAFGDDEGWDAELGLRTEIVPLAKPYGLYAGNVFQGIVKLEGEAVSHAEVEVEYYNQSRSVDAPTDYMITQTVKADGNGVFTYAPPASGWWGFAALNTADEKLPYKGEDKDVELGAVIWVYFHDWK